MSAGPVPVPRRHALRQGAVIRALLATGVAAMRSDRPSEIALPSPPRTQTVPPRSPELIRDYVRHCGGAPGWYRSTLPAHLFPQWGFPLLARNLHAIPYDMRKVLNGGCRIEIHRPLPAGEPLQLQAVLEEIDDNGRRAVLKNRLTTGTASAPDAVTAWMYAIVPLPRPAGEPRAKKQRPRVPAEATELGRFRLTPAHALDFATLTGACMVALGPYTAGVMTEDERLATDWMCAAEKSGELMWRLPLQARLKEQLRSKIADMRNTGERFGGALTAGLFLSEFIEGKRWMHVDIAGPAMASKAHGVTTAGGSGFPVPTILELLMGDIQLG